MQTVVSFRRQSRQTRFRIHVAAAWVQRNTSAVLGGGTGKGTVALGASERREKTVLVCIGARVSRLHIPPFQPFSGTACSHKHTHVQQQQHDHVECWQTRVVRTHTGVDGLAIVWLD